MAAAATARSAPARRAPAAPARRAPARRPRRRPASARRTRRRSAPTRRPRRRSAATVRAVKPAVAAGAALLPQAAVRGVGAVRDISDSGLIVRLTRGRGWIAVLCVLLGGIVTLNVLSLSLNAGSGRLAIQIDDLKTQVSTLRGQIDERLSASRVEAEAARLGLAVPDPEAISYSSASNGDAERLANLLATDSFLTAPSQPSSYPTGGSTYALPAPASPATTTVAPSTTTTTTPTPSSGSDPSSSPPASGGSGGPPPSTGGVGL
jgi:hypothetical protein